MLELLGQNGYGPVEAGGQAARGAKAPSLIWDRMAVLAVVAKAPQLIWDQLSIMVMKSV